MVTVTTEPRPEAPPIDPRIRERRVAVRREEGRRRLRVVVGTAILAAIVGAAVAITRSPLLDLDRVEISGATHTSAADIARAGSLRTGTLLVDLDPDASARAIRTLPWVADAEVVRRWPGSVVVTVVERAPAAAVAIDGGWALVAVDGHVLSHQPEQPSGVLVVAGVAAPGAPGTVLPPESRAAVEVAAALAPAVRDRVAVIEATPAGEVDLLLAAPKARVRLGTTDRLDAKLLAVETVLTKVSTVRLTTIDVRAPETPVLTRDP